MTDHQLKIVRWLANGETGTSSKTMAFWLGFEIKMDRDRHPLDPADLDRCLRLLHYVPEMRPRLHKMAEVSPVWAALVARWDEVEQCHLNEAGLDWSKARSAPKTYDLMQSIIEPVERTEFNNKWHSGSASPPHSEGQ